MSSEEQQDKANVEEVKVEKLVPRCQPVIQSNIGVVIVVTKYISSLFLRLLIYTILPEYVIGLGRFSSFSTSVASLKARSLSKTSFPSKAT